MRRIWLIMAFLGCLAVPAIGQRSYKSSSVLSSGTWYKIAVKDPGIYRIDIPFLKSLGVNTDQLSSASIRLYGNGGQMLPEPCNGVRTDDLQEDAIEVEDGGDGLFNGSDYFLFYASGPHVWLKDTLNRQFSHRKNLFSEESFYFLSFGGTGKRIGNLSSPQNPDISITSFDERWFHELDTFNFLSSGKDWYGEEFANVPGGAVSRSFTVANTEMPHLDSSQPLSVTANCMARSIGTGSRFNLSVNNVAVSELDIPPVTDGSYDVFGKALQSRTVFQVTRSPLTIALNFTPGSFNAQGWLDWLEISGRGLLSLDGLTQLSFRDWNSVGSGHTGSFSLGGAGATTQVWDITDPASAQNMLGVLNGSVFSFVNDCNTLHEYVAFTYTAGAATASKAGMLTPRAIGKTDNQNLHQATQPQLLIITDPGLVSQAQRLAQFHLQQDHLKTLIVTSQQVYNEFAGGDPDPTAIRDYVKMFYDRAAGDSTKRPNYLLLFGAGSYDYKDRLVGNTSLVAAYESQSSLDPLNTYTSDDFFGFLDDNEDVNAINTINLLDIGIGRIPARTATEASAVVDKILHYSDQKTQGPWRNEVNLIADDGDQNLHFTDAEGFAATITATAPACNVDKIYLDAYKEQNTPAGGRYPQVNQAISSQIYNGTLIWNYTGHGSSTRLSNEDVLDQDIINGFSNPDKLPLFITATCDFTPYDNPIIRSIGADLLVRKSTGAVALMTTTRLVFAFSNKVINNNYLLTALQPGPDGTYHSLGDAERLAKNFTYQTQTDAVNNRKFTLVGDPALTLAFPRYKVVTTSINGKAVTATPDTLKALNQYTVGGMVTDNSGAVISSFSGTLYATVFDKPRTLSTLGNNAGSFKADFQVQDNVLYKGKVQVSNGAFSLSFVVPKDINYQYGKGKISYYAGGPAATGAAGPDGNGAYTGFLVGGSGGSGASGPGPAIQAYLNDEKFVDGGITNQNPILLLHLQDSVGINITGTGIGHDIVAILDNNTQNPLVLNGFYEADLNTFKKGTVRYPLPVLEDGEHSLMIKAWDVANNSSQVMLTFRVVKSQHLTLEHVLNYPNPFTTHTSFWFEHNRPGDELQVMVQIFTVSGKLVKSIRRTINTPGNRSSEIEWDGKDDYGSKIGRGVYIYRLRVRASDGTQVDKLEKLLIL
ncbi:MAG TPA: type IX secretion system sortase PorU [Puia sp.]|nr:type IX secretion system sortase PorU [Puia sp.]